jgi:adenylate cyclase
MAEPEVRQRLAAILAADVVGYSRLMGDDERATIATLQAHRGVFRAHIEANGGRVVDMAGDAVLAVFASVSGAVTAGLEAQQALQADNTTLDETRRMDFRVGINLGEIHEADDGTVYGDGVNIAARIESLALPGAIAISDDLYRQVRDRLPVQWHDGGVQTVKNIARAIRVWHWPKAPEADAPSATDKPSIAVLPFNNMSGDAEQEYFADGMTEDIITDISKVSSLLVIARNSTFAYKGKSPDIREVSRNLGVKFVLEGSVRKARNRVRINAQLIDGATGGHIWAERYDGDLEDIFAVQDKVTREIVDALKVTLTPGEESRRGSRGKVNPEAYDWYVRGRAEIFALTEQGMVEGRAKLERAMALDPDFAPTYASLSLLCSIEHMNGWNGADASRLEEAVNFARKALATDENEPKAHHALALSLMWLGNLDTAEAAALRAIALDANFAGAFTALGSIRDYAGKHELAVEALQQALRLDPEYNVALQFLGRAQFWLARYDEAEATFKARLVKVPRSDMTRAFLASLYGHTGQHQEAQRLWQELREINPDFSVERLRHVLPYVDTAWHDRFADGLRRAGLDI